jgi:deoxyribonuclease-4
MIKFGPSGNSNSFYEAGFTSTFETPQYLYDKGLNAFEYSFGRGANISVEKAKLLGEEFAKYGIEVSVHAPYYINFGNESEEMAAKSTVYVLSSLKRLKAFGGKRCVFHTAGAANKNREEVFRLTYSNIIKLVETVYNNGYGDMTLCPETMGKINQIGTLDEILQICGIDKIFIPCIDFGHLYARERGLFDSESDYKRIIDKIFESLGEERAKNIHIHFSKIQYGKSGEIRHLTMNDKIYGPDFEPLALVLAQYDMTPVVLSESDGTQAEDAMLMKDIYEKQIRNKKCELGIKQQSLFNN